MKGIKKTRKKEKGGSYCAEARLLRGASVVLFAFLVAYVSVSIFIPAEKSSAVDCEDGTTSGGVLCNTDDSNVLVDIFTEPQAYYVAVSSTHSSAGTPISLSYSQDGSSGTTLGNIASASDSVHVETNSPLNHQLLLSTSGTRSEASIPSSIVANNLTGASTQESSGSLVANTFVAPGGGNSLNSATTLSANTWGFAVPSSTSGLVTNNFDADYSSPTKSSKFAKVPAKNSEVLVLQDTTSESNATFYYATLLDRDIVPGSYGNTVLYTALAEQPSELRVTPQSAKAGNTITIYTSINTTNIAGETATVTFYQEEAGVDVDKGTCTSPEVHLSANNYLYVTCTVPAGLISTDIYGISLSLTNLALTLKQDQVFSSSITLADFTYMQDVTAAACSATPQATAGGANIYTLIDHRGSNKSYNVAKLADGNCWMVQNLALDGGITIDQNDSNVTSSITLPATQNSGDNDYPASMQIWAERSQDAGLGYGNYYTWCAATALASGCDTSTEPTTSICPKGWRLPSNDGNPSYNNLFQVAGINSMADAATKVAAVEAAPYSFTRAGSYDYGYYGQGSYGIYWSRTPDYSDFAYIFDYDSSIFRPQNLDDRDLGFSVRCVYGS